MESVDGYPWKLCRERDVVCDSRKKRERERSGRNMMLECTSGSVLLAMHFSV